MTDQTSPASPGRLLWVIADGWIPPSSTGPQPQMRSHETVCLVNAGAADALVRLRFLFSERDPVDAEPIVVPLQRVRHVVVNDLPLPSAIPHGEDYAVVVRSDVPIVVQHTRMDTRQAANSMMSTIAFSE